jgi:hypothetical protein
LEWGLDDSRLNYGFKVVHSKQSSPRLLAGTDCSVYGSPSLPLTELAGDPGFVVLLNFLDTGKALDKEYSGVQVKDMREFTELFRRLYVPHYEEARIYLDDAKEDELIYDLQDKWTSQENLKRIIEKYARPV